MVDGEPRAPSDLAELLGAKVETVSYHVLELAKAETLEADSVESGRRGSIRRLYRVAPGLLND